MRSAAAESAALALLLLTAGEAHAHVMSVSNSTLTLEGSVARLAIELPAYETEHLENPEQSVLDAFSLRNDGVAIPRVEGSCAARDENFVCEATYALEGEASRLEVECRLPEVTVANHVHILRTTAKGFTDQKVFDYSFRKHEVRFRKPSAVELWFERAAAGALRVVLGPALLLFLVALAVAARSWPETARIAGAFLTSQVVTALLTARYDWLPPARFVEAAGALTIAYIAVEVLALPDAGGRWLVAGGMGAFHGLYFGIFLEQSKMEPGGVLSGALATEALVLLGLGALVARLTRDFGAVLFRRVAAGGLLAIGLCWFALSVFS